MNWKRILAIGGTTVVGVIAVICLARSCNGNGGNQDIDLNEVHNTLVGVRNVIDSVKVENKNLRDSLGMYRDSLATYRDSTAFYKQGLEDCENGKKKQPVKSKKRNVAPAVKRAPRDTVFVVCEEGNNRNNTTINLQPQSRNNKNIIVGNSNDCAGVTNITLGNGAVNDGNIVVNNGGDVTINGDNSARVDSLAAAIQALKEQPRTSSSACVQVRKVVVKRYVRTR